MIREHSVLGMNERNIRYIYPYNDRKHYQLADDKLLTKKILGKAEIPTPRLINYYEHYFQLENLSKDLKNKSNFVIKPARSMGGGGIILFENYADGYWHTITGVKYDPHLIRHHTAMILGGVFSLDNERDVVIVEEKIQLHDELKRISSRGIPDIRVIVFNKQPLMAMLRLPTKKSGGKANLHAGGIAVGIKMQSGHTFVNPNYDKSPEIHPDNGENLCDFQIPFWKDIIKISEKIVEIVPLGYMGIDFVIDQRHGPLVLELNVRPGLEIQNVNGRGLRKILQKYQINIK